MTRDPMKGLKGGLCFRTACDAGDALAREREKAAKTNPDAT